MITRRQFLLMFKVGVKGHGHALNMVVKTLKTKERLNHFEIDPATLVHILVMVRGPHLLIIKVKGQDHTLKALLFDLVVR